MPIVIPQVTLNDTFDVWRSRTNLVIQRWNDLGDFEDVNILGGSINATPIGATSPSTGTFTTILVSNTIDVSGAAILLSANQISGDKISGGTIDNVNIELAGLPTIDAHATSKLYVDTLFSGVNNIVNALNVFSAVAVSGQSTVQADSSSDTLTLVAGTNITLTTNATQDSVTFNVTGLGSLAALSLVTDTQFNGQLQLNHGGSGASTAAGARTNFGLVIGTDVQAFNSKLQTISTSGTTAGLAIVTGADATAQRTSLLAAARTQTFIEPINVERASNKTYLVMINVPFGFTINKIHTKAISGSCLCYIRINNTIIGDQGAQVVNTSLNTTIHTTNNVVNSGDEVELQIFSNSSCQGAAISIEYTRVFV